MQGADVGIVPRVSEDLEVDVQVPLPGKQTLTSSFACDRPKLAHSACGVWRLLAVSLRCCLRTYLRFSAATARPNEAVYVCVPRSPGPPQQRRCPKEFTHDRVTVEESSRVR
jgi:hypothetical protein